MYNLNSFLKAANVSQRPILEIALEALRLRFSYPYLDLSEYLDFKLYLNDLTFSEKAAFCGHRMQSTLIEIVVDEYSKFMAIDKVTMYFLFRASGFPTPEIHAIYRSRRPSVLLNIATPQDLEDYLRKPGSLPIYFKRSSGSYGHGNTLADHLNGDMLHLGTGSSEPLRDFCCSLDDGGTLGWILQEPLTAHSEIAEISGTEKISSIRIHTILLDSGPQIMKAIFKVNVGNLDCDNFDHGKTGNLLGAVDIKTGKIFRIISGTGLDQIENPLHPKTGRNLIGFELPYWNKVVELVLEAHLAFPGYLCPGWDVAICETGPTILELNYFGDLKLSQHAYRRGFIDPEFMNFLQIWKINKMLYMTPKRRRKLLASSGASLIKGHVGIKRHHWQW
ncbi:MAG: hypothetical protein F6K56_02145 [Moorea sp. SIO3G5]|nr:hypothetical protein [Moorena sp. SIO3G5]